MFNRNNDESLEEKLKLIRSYVEKALDYETITVEEAWNLITHVVTQYIKIE